MTQKYWLEEEVAYLKLEAENKPSSEIGKKLGRSKNSVVHKIRKLGLQGFGQGTHAKWTEEQFKALKETAYEMTTKQFSDKHGLSFQSVRHWARKMDIKFIKYAEAWTEEELAILRGHTITSVIQQMTGRSRDAVQRKAKMIGVVLAESRGEKGSKPKVECIAKEPINKHSRVGKKVKVERCLIEWCPNCSSPVADWSKHWDRMPQCRVVRKQA